MNPTPRLLTLALLLVTLLALAACGGARKPPPEPLTNAPYQGGKPLPPRVVNLSGTALFSVSEDLATGLGAAGADAPGGIDSFFVLLNSKVPTEGVLVRAGSLTEGARLQDLESQKVSVTGSVRRLEDPTILTHVQERYGISLARDEQGRPQWIDNETKIDLEASPAAAEGPPGLEKPSPGPAEPALGEPPGLAKPAPGKTPAAAEPAPGETPAAAEPAPGETPAAAEPAPGETPVAAEPAAAGSSAPGSR